MNAFALSIARFLRVRFHPWSWAPDDQDSDLVAKIPPAMVQHLRQEGLRMFLSLPLVLLGAFVAVWWLLGWFWHDDSALSAGHIAMLIAIQMLVGTSMLRAPFRRELSYRRDNGKWRWDQ